MAKISIQDLARAADFLDEINDPRVGCAAWRLAYRKLLPLLHGLARG